MTHMTHMTHMTKELGPINSIDEVANTFFSFAEDESRDVVIDHLLKILHFLETYPISASERVKIEHMAVRCMATYQIDNSHAVYKGFSQRFRFAFVPGVSTLSILSGKELLRPCDI